MSPLQTLSDKSPVYSIGALYKKQTNKQQQQQQQL